MSIFIQLNLRNVLYVILVICLPRIIVMNHIWYAVLIPAVGNHPNVILEDHNISALPFLYIGYIRSQTDFIISEPELKIPYSPEKRAAGDLLAALLIITVSELQNCNPLYSW